MKQGYSEDLEGLGLYITDLLGKVPAEQLDELRRLLDEATPTRSPARRAAGWSSSGEGASFYYDEWDYHIGDYRQRWCRLREMAVEGDTGEFFNRTLLDYARLIPEVRRQFQRIRPEMYRIVQRARGRRGLRSERRHQRARRPARAPAAVAEALRRAHARGARRRDACS